MGIGLGVVLLLVGLVLALGVVDLPASVDDAVATSTFGWILILVGALAIVLALVMNAQRSRSHQQVVEERRVDPPRCPRRTLCAMTHPPPDRTDQEGDPLVRLVEIWHHACADFVDLVRDIPREQWDLPTDLAGWTVKDNVAHTAHLEAVLAGAPEETVEVPQAPHLTGLMSHYTEQGVLARRDRDMAALADEIEQVRGHALRRAPRQPARRRVRAAAHTRRRAVELPDPAQQPAPRRVDARPGRTTGDRPPGGYDCPAATHVLTTFGRALPMVVGKRVAPPAGTRVRVDVPDAELRWTVGDRRGRAGHPARRRDRAVEPTAAVTLDPRGLRGARRRPTATGGHTTADRGGRASSPGDCSGRWR